MDNGDIVCWDGTAQKFVVPFNNNRLLLLCEIRYIMDVALYGEDGDEAKATEPDQSEMRRRVDWLNSLYGDNELGGI